MFSLLLPIVIGILFGITTGLVPGIHPNTIILIVPFLASLGLDPYSVILFLVAMGVSNSIADVIPSILLGASDSGSELAILPGHRLLMKGLGYHAIKMTVLGSLWSTILCIFSFPLLIFTIPYFYQFIKPFIYSILVFIAVYLILSESGKKKIFAAVSFVLSGLIGILSAKLPISNSVVLFPIFSGLFGVSMLLLQLKNKPKIPKQSFCDVQISKKTINRSVILGSVGGIASGFLPGIGPSQTAAIFSVDKNENSFLISMGAITTANIIISILSLWLIGRARSGVAIAIGEIKTIGFGDVLLIVFAALAVTGMSAIITLNLAKKFIKIIERIDYNRISVGVITFIFLLALYFTGPYGILLLILCSSLGIFANLVGVRRGNLMGVIILPTIIFYMSI